VLRLLPDAAHVPQGAIHIGGVDVLSLDDAQLAKARWRDFAVVVQSAMDALNPVLTVADQIGDTLAAHGVTNKARQRERATELLALVEIGPELLDAYPHTLSGGMRRAQGRRTGATGRRPRGLLR
jgi:ABC-type glutathione transport system ATPase component